MSDNVFLFGAGFSADAQIPLMRGFMDRMWMLAKTGRCNGQPIPPKELSILEEALKVRGELDGYHGRAAFDVWNIEDILSILSFSSEKRLDEMTKAIAQVIELTCNVKHDGKLNHHHDQIGAYGGFWRALIKWAIEKKAPVPPILTFNYDLVLERSLLHALVGKHYRNTAKFEYGGIEVAYSGAVCENVRLKCETGQFSANVYDQVQGMILKEIPADTSFSGQDFLRFEILKLHGSVNFPRNEQAPLSNFSGAKRLITALEDPLILPPIFNKATDSLGRGVWSRALEVLRSCKRLIVCGYSLPTTDIYMQYFLKAALGPNQELDHIYVFDPVLFKNEENGEGVALRERYACNFSQPIQRRIQFRPLDVVTGSTAGGTLSHLTRVLSKQPDALLFG